MKSNGVSGFDETYWTENYSDPVSMDCVGNATEHANYLKYLLELEYVDVSRVVDFGFGMGWLFREMLKVFLPHTAYGIEPSSWMFNIVKNKVNLKVVRSMNVKIEKMDILTWCKSHSKNHDIFDLGICTSVFQYLSDAEIEKVLPVMARKVKYLYFTVPTNKELDRQIHELEFKDVYAIRRSRSKYLKMISPYFAFVSSRLLESKVHFDGSSTAFTELLFRF